MKLTHADMKPASAYNTIQSHPAIQPHVRLAIQPPKRGGAINSNAEGNRRGSGQGSRSGFPSVLGGQGGGRSVGQVSGKTVGWGGGPVHQRPGTPVGGAARGSSSGAGNRNRNRGIVTAAGSSPR
eukprot:49116-Prorocentrum_minimum.AAC.1